MKIILSKEEKAALLVAVSRGELDTAKIPRIYDEIKGYYPFEFPLLTDEDIEELKRINAKARKP